MGKGHCRLVSNTLEAKHRSHTLIFATQLAQLQVTTTTSGRSHCLLVVHLAPLCWEDIMVKEDLWVKERILPKVYRKPTVRLGHRKVLGVPDTDLQETVTLQAMPSFLVKNMLLFFVKKNNDVGTWVCLCAHIAAQSHYNFSSNGSDVFFGLYRHMYSHTHIYRNTYNYFLKLLYKERRKWVQKHSQWSLGVLMLWNLLFLASKEKKRKCSLIWQSWFCQLSQIWEGDQEKETRWHTTTFWFYTQYTHSAVVLQCFYFHN